MSPAASSKKKTKAVGRRSPARQVFVEKPASDVYTGVLWASLVCIVFACLFLGLEAMALR